MALIIQDNFNGESSEVNLTAHVTTLNGYSWASDNLTSNIYVHSTGRLNVASVDTSSDGDFPEYYISDVPTIVDYVSKARCKMSTNALNNTGVGVRGRRVDDANELWAGLIGSTTAGSRKLALLSGTTELATFTINWNSDQYYEIEIECIDSVTTNEIDCVVKLDGDTKITHTVTAAEGGATFWGVSSKPGIRGVTFFASAILSWDDFEVNAPTTISGTGSTSLAFDGSATLKGGKVIASGSTSLDFDGNATLKVLIIVTGSSTLVFSGLANLSFNFSFKWSIEHLEASTNHGFPSVYVEVNNTVQPSDDFSTLVSNEEVFERRLLEMPRLQEVQLDERSGLAGFQRVTIQADNSDGLLNGLDLQDSFVRMFFVDTDGVSYKEFNGKVVDWTLSHTVTINVEDLDALAFTQELPKRTLNDLIEAEKAALSGQLLTDFTNSVVADDLGKPIPIIFGRAVKVPLLYVKADETNREYDYIIGEGVGLNSNNFKEVFTVYRDERTLGDIEGQVNFGASDLNTIALEAADNNPDNFYQYWWLELFDDSALTDLVDIKYIISSNEDSTTPTVELDSNLNLGGGTLPNSDPYYYRLREYRFYDGSQTSPYPGYAFIRSKKRFGTSSRTDDLYADVNGLQDEVNRVRAIESILSNSTWGLGLTVDATSFTTAAELFWNSSTMMGIDPFTCEGAILNQTTATDIFQKLLSFRDMVLYKEGDIKISVDQDKPTPVFNFGLGDEAGYNNILNASPAITYKHPNEKVKDLKVRYRKNHRENDNFLHEFTRSSSSNGTDENLDLPFVYEHTTADNALDYKRKRLTVADRNLSLDIGDDGKKAKRGDLVTVDIPTLGVSSNWEIVSSSVTPAGSNNLNLVPFSSTPYSYTSFTSDGGTLPVDESFDIPPDYSGSIPFPVINISVTMLMDTVGISQFPYALLAWDPPEDNYGGAEISLRKLSGTDDDYRAVGVFQDSARIEGLTPGIPYIFSITSLNITGELKGLATVEDNSGLGFTAGGDDSPPEVPMGLTGTSKRGEVEWTWTAITGDDTFWFYELEFYPTNSVVPANLIETKKVFRDEEPRYVLIRNTGNLTSSLSTWARIRSVDFKGNSSGFTGLVKAGTDTTPINTGDIGDGQVPDSKLVTMQSLRLTGTLTIDGDPAIDVTSSGAVRFLNGGDIIMRGTTGGDTPFIFFQTNTGAQRGRLFLESGQANIRLISENGSDINIISNDNLNLYASNGRINLGLSNADEISIPARLVGNISPKTPGGSDLGTNLNRFDEIFTDDITSTNGFTTGDIRMGGGKGVILTEPDRVWEGADVADGFVMMSNDWIPKVWHHLNGKIQTKNLPPPNVPRETQEERQARKAKRRAAIAAEEATMKNQRKEMALLQSQAEDTVLAPIVAKEEKQRELLKLLKKEIRIKNKELMTEENNQKKVVKVAEEKEREHERDREPK